MHDILPLKGMRSVTWPLKFFFFWGGEYLGNGERKRYSSNGWHYCHCSWI